nr:hypothetical protein HUO10_006229 [Paraburkholderia busanensis]
MEHPLAYANAFLAAHYGMDCATLLAPIDVAQPQGTTLRGTPVWNAIRRARESDDASLPLGAWVRQLKRANWGEVARASLEALSYRSKDLHLAVWLCEALLQERGFAGLAAGVAVVDALCERYWDVLYPGSPDGDYEHRANLVRWLNEKLIAPARLVPLTAAYGADASTQPGGVGLQPSGTSDSERAYTWADCEQLRRQQQASSQTRGGDEGGLDAAGFDKAMAATSDELLSGQHSALSQALAALAKLGATLDQCFDDDAPGLGALRGVLEQIHAFISAQLVQRGLPFGVTARAASAAGVGAGSAPLPAAASYAQTGVVPLTETISVSVSMAAPMQGLAGEGGHVESNGASVADAGDAAAAAHHASAHAPDDSSSHANENPHDPTSAPPIDANASAEAHSLANLINARRHAYTQLAVAAATLAELEPHSPVPYLIQKAIEWGSLNTAQLYDELFIQGRGQLNVFELLGIGMQQPTENEA